MIFNITDYLCPMTVLNSKLADTKISQLKNIEDKNDEMKLPPRPAWHFSMLKLSTATTATRLDYKPGIGSQVQHQQNDCHPHVEAVCLCLLISFNQLK